MLREGKHTNDETCCRNICTIPKLVIEGLCKCFSDSNLLLITEQRDIVQGLPQADKLGAGENALKLVHESTVEDYCRSGQANCTTKYPRLVDEAQSRSY